MSRGRTGFGWIPSLKETTESTLAFMIMRLFHGLELLRGTRGMAGAVSVLTMGSLVDNAALAVHVLSTGAASALLVVL